MRLIDELKRRNVFKVGTAYIALSWALLQFTDIVAPIMQLPEWTVPMLLWLSAIGFPCVLLFSWLYELTPEGLRREADVEHSQSIAGETGRKLNYLIAALLVVSFALFIVNAVREPEPIAADANPAQPAGTPGEAAVPAAISPVAGNAVPAMAPSPAATPVQLAPDDKSIAVLPFTDMSAAGDQEYMSDGIAEELLNLLTKVNELRVIARTSSFSFKGKDVKISDVARELNVAHVLEGSVRTSGNRVRITVQLIRASDSTHLWSETYDRTLDDIFAVQDEIAGAVVYELKVTLLGDAPKVHVTDPKSYALFLKARQARIVGSTGWQAEAATLLEQALAIDPRYAEAWVELAVIRRQEAYAGLRSNDEGFRLAKQAAQRALDLDASLGPAYAQLARIAWEYDGDAATAAGHIARAFELDPAHPLTLTAAGYVALGLGRLDAALALSRFAMERDPINTGPQFELGLKQLYARRYDEAIETYRNLLAREPEGTFTHFNLGLALLLKGDAQAAITQFEADTDGMMRSMGLVLGYTAVGRRAEADALLRELERTGADTLPYSLASLQAMRGDADAAFKWLDKAVKTRDPGLSEVLVDPMFDKIHNDPRWLPFLRGIGRAPEQLAAIPFELKLP